MDAAQQLFYSLALAEKLAILMYDVATLVTFHRMLKINPTGSVEDLEGERQRMMDELNVKLSQITLGEDSARLALKEALLYFAEQF